MTKGAIHDLLPRSSCARPLTRMRWCFLIAPGAGNRHPLPVTASRIGWRVPGRRVLPQVPDPVERLLQGGDPGRLARLDVLDLDPLRPAREGPVADEVCAVASRRHGP